MVMHKAVLIGGLVLAALALNKYVVRPFWPGTILPRA
jgi:hypothetical protein